MLVVVFSLLIVIATIITAIKKEQTVTLPIEKLSTTTTCTSDIEKRHKTQTTKVSLKTSVKKPKKKTTTTTKTQTEINTTTKITTKQTTAPKTEYVETTKITTTTQQKNTDTDNSENLTHYGWYEGTWYTGGVGTYGASGRTLISNYSVASNYFSFGTILYIEGHGLDGYYRVDDCGQMANNVVDFYYSNGCVPSDFARDGRVNIQVYVVN